MTDAPTIHYQPIVDLVTGQIRGLEALIRFAEEDGNLRAVPERLSEMESDPDYFEQVMRHFVNQLHDDLELINKVDSKVYLSINMPPSMLGRGAMRKMIAQLEPDQPLDRFVVEVTERQALTDAGRVALAEARELGMRVAVDDFGTGHSGLTQLLGLDFDMLKLDRSQIVSLLRDVRADRLVRGVVALASALRVLVVAEGVETHDQAVFLRAAGVDLGQGWFWQKPIEASHVADLLERGLENTIV